MDQRMNEDEADGFGDLASAMDFVDEALRRLQAELECVQGHWADLMGADNMDDSVEMAAHVYALIQHCTALSSHFQATGKVLFDWIAPDSVREQLVVEGIERVTGNPYTVIGRVSGGLLLEPEDIVVPDDIGDLSEN